MAVMDGDGKVKGALPEPSTYEGRGKLKSNSLCRILVYCMMAVQLNR